MLVLFAVAILKKEIDRSGSAGIHHTAHFPETDGHGGRCGRGFGGPEPPPQTANEECEREKAAKHTMTIATAYVLGALRS